MSEYQNRSIVLVRRPVGEVRDEDFRTDTEIVRDLEPGEFLIKVLYLSLDPYMRPKMNDVESYMPPMDLDAVVQGENIGRIVESRSEKFAVGELVTSYTGWQQYAIVSDETPMIHKVNPEGLPPSVFLGAAGMPGRTGYMGLTRVGDPKPGETVVVSTAAGAVGSSVGQIARISGCRAVGITGGAEKVARCREVFGYDAAIDYKGTDDLGAALDAACGDGIDVFFDNTGGEVLDAVLARINLKARIVLCGAISHYNDATPAPGPVNYFNLTPQRARMEGFIVLDYLARFEEAAAKLSAWCGEGKIAWKVDVQEGFENAPQTFKRLFSGDNFGKQLLRIAERPVA